MISEFTHVMLKVCVKACYYISTSWASDDHQPSTHTTLFWHPYDVVLTLWMSKRCRVLTGKCSIFCKKSSDSEYISYPNHIKQIHLSTRFLHTNIVKKLSGVTNNLSKLSWSDNWWSDLIVVVPLGVHSFCRLFNK